MREITLIVGSRARVGLLPSQVGSNGMRTSGLWQSIWSYCVIFALIASVAGCRSGSDRPPTRFGSLPFPGAASLFAAAEPGRLAPHYYRPRYARPFHAEGDRGIVYTQKAGFVDISHAREAMDWTRYISMQLAAAPVNGNARTATFRFENLHVSVSTPAEASDHERIDVAAAITYRLLAWHEVSTWRGYSLVPFVSERRSAFTPDDLTAHAIGVRVAIDVLQYAHDLDTYERHAGAALERALAALEPLPPEEAQALCRRLEGVWWQGLECRVADTQMGLTSGVKYPLLVSSASAEPLAGEGIVWSCLRAPSYRFVVKGSVSSWVRNSLGTREISSDAQLELLAEQAHHDLSRTRAYSWGDTPPMGLQDLATR